MSETNTVPGRIEALRRQMQKENLDAYFIFGTDPHMSEYVAHRWHDRAWISGFTGSAGVVVVTAGSAGLWTDSRYHLQAEEQLRGSGIELFREGVPGVLSIDEWLAKELPAAASAGADAWTLSLSRQRSLKSSLARFGILFRSTPDLLDRIWTDRPEMPARPIYQHDTKYAGQSRGEKLGRLRRELQNLKADYQLISSLSDIAWLFNLRGSDIDYNPLFISYALISSEKAYLALQRKSLSDELASLLEEEGVTLAAYDQIAGLLREVLDKDQRLIFDPDMVNTGLSEILHASCFPIERRDITSGLKSIKGGTEIEGIRKAMIKDGVAMVRFIHWLQHSWERAELTEISIGAALEQFRSEQAGFIGESFHPIVGFRDHGAVIHYSADENSSYRVDQPGLLLVDSGGHYLDGTTDITRTIALGEPSSQQQEDYTTVLKGHIELAMARFPKGTRGVQLDALAKRPCWERGMHYAHGTGHGVGYFLNVHEGPQSISPRMIDIPVEPGMLCSNEPGVYREGQYGIRIENLVLVKEQFSTPFGTFLGFETVTLCPFDRSLINPGMLSTDQLRWVNEYHSTVFNALSPLLSREEQRWLGEVTAPLS